jgi:hypothetical protein
LHETLRIRPSAATEPMEIKASVLLLARNDRLMVLEVESR